MHADIFCRVIDNFGDIGVTWRLVRQLQSEYQWSIRLWVDDLRSFQRLEPRLDSALARQTIADVEIIHWTDPAPALLPRPVVIASFSCDLPTTYLAQMSEQESLWVNLEYLSAEKWVEGCHGLPSLRSDGLSSHFFFPGFTPQTGGLLRENALLAKREAWLKDCTQQYHFIKSLGVPEAAMQAWRPQGEAPPTPGHTGRLISLFCYPKAPLAPLLEVLSRDHQDSVLLVPEGVVPDLTPHIRGSLHVVRIPFVSQEDYDKILWCADLNFVRGEDSIVRALWAGKPFVWHIYPQSEQTHLKKLEAWLARCDLPGFAQKLLLEWNQDSPEPALRDSFRLALSPAELEKWGSTCQLLSQKLALQPDLATSLDHFCREKLQHLNG